MSDWSSVEHLLSDWCHQASVNQEAHTRAYRHYRRMNYWLGIPVVVCTTIVGTTVFATLQQGDNQVHPKVKIAAGVISVISAVLASLQTFLSFGERAEKHRVVGSGYGGILKEIEELQSLPVHLRGDVKQNVDTLREQMNALAKESPEVPIRIHRRAQALTMKARKSLAN